MEQLVPGMIRGGAKPQSGKGKRGQGRALHAPVLQIKRLCPVSSGASEPLHGALLHDFPKFARKEKARGVD